MFIPVVLEDGHEKLVSTDEFQRLLSEEQVILFKCSDGWAAIGRTKMRNQQVPDNGVERRQYNAFWLAYDGQNVLYIPRIKRRWGMKIECPNCNFSKVVEKSILPNMPKFIASCQKCNERFTVTKEEKSPIIN